MSELWLLKEEIAELGERRLVERQRPIEERRGWREVKQGSVSVEMWWQRVWFMRVWRHILSWFSRGI